MPGSRGAGSRPGGGNAFSDRRAQRLRTQSGAVTRHTHEAAARRLEFIRGLSRLTDDERRQALADYDQRVRAEPPRPLVGPIVEARNERAARPVVSVEAMRRAAMNPEYIRAYYARGERPLAAWVEEAEAVDAMYGDIPGAPDLESKAASPSLRGSTILESVPLSATPRGTPDIEALLMGLADADVPPPQPMENVTWWAIDQGVGDGRPALSRAQVAGLAQRREKRARDSDEESQTVVYNHGGADSFEPAVSDWDVTQEV